VVAFNFKWAIIVTLYVTCHIVTFERLKLPYSHLKINGWYLLSGCNVSRICTISFNFHNTSMSYLQFFLFHKLSKWGSERLIKPPKDVWQGHKEKQTKPVCFFFKYLGKLSYILVPWVPCLLLPVSEDIKTHSAFLNYVMSTFS
jgi:hypothetical protein